MNRDFRETLCSLCILETNQTGAESTHCWSHGVKPLNAVLISFAY